MLTKPNTIVNQQWQYDSATNESCVVVLGKTQGATNSGFDSDTAWTKGTGWAIAAGVATKTAGTADTLDSDNVSLPITTERVISAFTITAITASTFRLSVGGFQRTTKSAVGRHVQTNANGGVAAGFQVVTTSTTAGSVDDVELWEMESADDANDTPVIDKIFWSLDAAPTAGSVYVMDNSGTLWTQDITAAGPGSMEFPNGFYNTKGLPLAVILQDTGGTAALELLVSYR